MLVALLLAGPALAQEDIRAELETKRKELIAARWEVLEMQARSGLYEAELDLIPRGVPLKGKPLEKRAGWLALLKDTLEEPERERLRALEARQEKLAPELKKAREAWHTALGENLRFMDEEMAAQARYGLPRPEGAAPRVWDGGTWAIVAWGVLACGVSLMLGLHGIRLRLRGRARARAKLVLAGLLVGLLLGPVASWVWALTPAGPNWLERERDALAKEIGKAQAQKAALKGTLLEQEGKLRQAREKLLAARLGRFPEGDDIRKLIQDKEEAAFEKLQGLLYDSQLTTLAADQGAQFLKDLSDKQEELNTILGNEEAHYRQKLGTRAVLGLGFALLAFLPLHFLERSWRRALKDQADQCPCCLRRDSLQMKKETNDPRFPEVHYLECDGNAEEDGCHYKFRASYRKLPRFCFPTVGIRGSGKTHWLVTAYDQIKNHRVHVPGSIQSAPGLGDEKEFDFHIEEILESHKQARPTVHAPTIPHPLIFHVRDADPLGKNTGMLNLFDFAGEMMTTHINMDQLRRRALLMEGFVLFLDPTQVMKKKGLLSQKDQVEALGAFHEQMRDMRELDVGTPIPVPVAVCVSKLDLVVSHNPFGGAAYPWIQQLQDSFSRPLSLRAIAKRSELCAQAMDVMFPGWNLVRTLEDNFGGRFMFFPMTPVSLERSELGQMDLSRRTIAPVGVLEPILWLLHMQGFTMLS